MRYWLILLLLLPLGAEQIEALEVEIDELERELTGLAQYNLRGDVGAIGYRSTPSETADTTQAVEVLFSAEQEFDEIILVPSIRRDTKLGYTSEAFPKEFTVSLITDDGLVTVAHLTESDLEHDRIAPYIISCPGSRAKGVRIEALLLSELGWNDQYYLILAEIMVFRGETNIALRQEVQVYPSRPEEEGSNPSRHRKHLVDGFLPYLMDAYAGERSVACTTLSDDTSWQSFRFDLGQPHPITQLSFHRTELSDTVPKSAIGTYAVPRQIIVEGANKPDFSDQQVLLNHQLNSIYEVGPIMSHLISDQRPYRYLRFRCQGRKLKHLELQFYIVGFSEIQVFSGDQNILQGLTPDTNARPSGGHNQPLSNITDGNNFYGEILSMRHWLNQLARRHEIECTLPTLRENLSELYSSKNKTARITITLLITMGVITLGIIAALWNARRIAIAKIKDQFSTDLHDELGANIHTIGLLSDMAQNSGDDEQARTQLHGEIRRMTERTGRAMYHLAGMLESSGLYRGLINDMERASKRIMSHYVHEFICEGEHLIHRIEHRKQIDIFLFYQECLVNISRHTDATFYRTTLLADERNIMLRIEDNGAGFEGEQTPDSLIRRAKMLRAKLELATSQEGGALITMSMKTPRLLKTSPEPKDYPHWQQ